MTITFQGGQYFDPKLGWLSEKPQPVQPQRRESTLPKAMIDDSMAYVLDDTLQKVIDNYKAYSERLKQEGETQWILDSDEYEQVIGDFTYKGNTMSCDVDLRSSYYVRDSLEYYENKRSEILALKDSGYCDDAINMLLKDLGDKFSSKVCGGLSEQLQVLGWNEKAAEEASLKFAKQYLSSRKDDRSLDQNAQSALRKIGLYDIDIDFGKPGHYGKSGTTGNFFLPAPFSRVTPESYFKGIAEIEERTRKLWEEEDEKWKPLTLQPREDFVPFA